MQFVVLDMILSGPLFWKILSRLELAFSFAVFITENCLHQKYTSNEAGKKFL